LASGEFHSAIVHLKRALALKEESLGRDHPDVATTLANLAQALDKVRKFQEAIGYADRALEIVIGQGGIAAGIFSNRGEIPRALGRFVEAEQMFERAAREELGDRDLADVLTGLGLVRLDLGRPVDAAQLLERALLIQQREEPDITLVAETRFGLARALHDSGDRKRAMSLARSARAAYLKGDAETEATAVDEWLTKRRRVALKPILSADFASSH
jgi:tetratricopeptide (TPR) repeat protein